MKNTWQCIQSQVGPLPSIDHQFTLTPNREFLLTGVLAQCIANYNAGPSQTQVDSLFTISVPIGAGAINVRPTQNVAFVAPANENISTLFFICGRGMNIQPLQMILKVGFVYTFRSVSTPNLALGDDMTNVITLEYDSDFGMPFNVNLNQ